MGGSAMNDNVVFGIRFGMLVLCAVIGIYYALARRPRKQQ